MAKISRDYDKDVTRICGLKLVQIEPRSTHQKRGLCWITSITN